MACLRHLHCTGLLIVSDYWDTSILPLCLDCCLVYCQLKKLTKKCNDSIWFPLYNASILRLTNHDQIRSPIVLKNSKYAHRMKMTFVVLSVLIDTGQAAKKYDWRYITAKWQQADLEPRILHKNKYLDNNGNRFIDSLNPHIRLYSYLED